MLLSDTPATRKPQKQNQKTKGKTIMKKFLALLLALVMVMGLATTASAATVTKKDGVSGPASITVTLPAKEEGATANNTYKIYKVFDAVPTADGKNISYTLVSGKNTAPAGFAVDAAGNVTYAGTSTNGTLNNNDIAAIKAYVTEADLVATVTTTAADTSFTVTDLPYGYYYITTTTGTVVTVDSTTPNASVSDKNKVPTSDKKITGANSVDEDGEKALAQIGTEVTFTGYVTVGSGVRNYVYHDTMSAGLKFAGTVTVKVGDKTVDASNYTLKTTGIGSETFNVEFKNEYINTLANGTVIEIVYKAVITDAAVTNDPENNTAYLSYGETGSVNKTPISETKVYNAKFTVTKTDGTKALAGAGFVIKKGDLFYKYTPATDTTAAKVEWVADIAQATENFSDAEGKVPAFVGLANGTYTLIEKTVPTGYNKAADSTFTIEEHDYTAANLEQATTVINNAGTELPTTGGMGTTMFYIFGFTMMMAAVVLLVTKKRMADAV